MGRTAASGTGERTGTGPARSATGWGAALRRAPVRIGAALRRPYLVDVGVAAGFLAAAAWLGHRLWPDPATRTLALNPDDQILIEWFLAVGTRVLAGDTGLYTALLNAPHGVNLLVNASSLGLGTLLAPVTLTWGAPVSFAVLTVANLAATATAWYLLFARTLGAHRAAAAVGGAVAGFAPAMVSQSNSHWHITAQWLVPAIVWSVVRLARAAAADHLRRQVTSGLWLAALVCGQLFIGEEILFLTALTLVLFTAAYAALRPAWARRVAPGFLAGLAIAIGTATIVLAYPLWVQFAGPGSVPNGLFSPHYFSADLASWVAFSPLSLAGSADTAALATGPAEYNTFLGWPLLIVVTGLVVWQRRQPLVLAAALAALPMAVLSLGPELVVNGTRPGVPLPFTLLVGLPVIDGALPQRYALAVVPLVATVLVVALDRARRQIRINARRQAPGHSTGTGTGSGTPGRRRGWHWLVPAATAAALLPLTPVPLPVTDREPVPEFISGGHWRGCVAPGGVLVPVPLPTPTRPEAMRWAAAAEARFAQPGGFFIGPHGPHGAAAMGVPARPTAALLAEVAETGARPAIGARHRAAARRDLAYWRAQCVVLAGHRNEAQLRAILTELLGPGQRVADAWTWPLNRPD